MNGELLIGHEFILVLVERMKLKFILILFLTSVSPAFSAEIPIFLGKELDKSVLANTFQMSNRELIEYIRSLGIVVYFLPIDAQPNMALDAQLISIMAPAGIQQRWSRFFEQNRVLGKYFSQHDRESVFPSPTIIITDLNDKWTLLHELIHYLFERELIQSGKYDSSIYATQSNSREDFLELFPALSDGHHVTNQEVDRVIQIFSDYMLSEIAVAKGLTLEEVVVEKTISSLYSQGAILYLNDGQKHNADVYIQENLTRITGQLNAYYEIYADLQKVLNGRPSGVLDKALKNLDWFKNEIEKLATTRTGFSN